MDLDDEGVCNLYDHYMACVYMFALPCHLSWQKR